MCRILQKLCFRLCERWQALVASPLRKALLCPRGLSIGRTILPRCHFSWPHKVRIGNDCTLERDLFFKHDGPWSDGRSIVIGHRVFLGRGCEFNVTQGVTLGDDCLIGSGCRFIDHNHTFADPSRPMNAQPNAGAPIVLEENVWLGSGVTVLAGVRIGRGAIIGAGAVVTQDIPAGERWAGVPARKLPAASA